MNTILLIWTVVSAGGNYTKQWTEYDWRPLGEFATAADCQRAARELGLNPARFRCITTGKGR